MNIFKPKKLNLEKIYNDNKSYFELLLLKDFVGNIPKEVNDDVIIKIFKEYGEPFERWTLWQAWYIQRKIIAEPIKITFYSGMMVYLKILNTMSRVHKKNYQPEVKPQREEVVETPWIDKALEDISSFGKDIKNYGNIKNNKSDKSTKVESTSETKGDNS